MITFQTTFWSRRLKLDEEGEIGVVALVESDESEVGVAITCGATSLMKSKPTLSIQLSILLRSSSSTFSSSKFFSSCSRLVANSSFNLLVYNNISISLYIVIYSRFRVVKKKSQNNHTQTEYRICYCYTLLQILQMTIIKQDFLLLLL